MAILKHEVWIDAAGLPGCCLAGSLGAAAREQFRADGGKLVWTFEAGSHFEAMSKYNAYLNREPYSSDAPQDREPYPEDWLGGQVDG